MAITENYMQKLRQQLEDMSNEPDPVVPPGTGFLSTGAQPGSWAKIVIMRDRVERGLPLWHAGDYSTGYAKGGGE